MELDRPLRRNTPDCPPRDASDSCKRVRRVYFTILGWSIDAVATFVQHNHVNIDLVPVTIREHKIVWTAYFEFDFVIATGLQELHEFRDVLLLNRDIEILATR